MATIIYSKEFRAALLRGEEPGWITRSTCRSYWVQLILSTPDWCDRKAVNALVRRARATNRVVDHIIPLTHPLVCGLTVPGNLRLISRAENVERSNSWWEYTPSLFTEPQQLRFW